MTYTPIFAFLYLLLLTLLGIYVSYMRIKAQVSYGDGGNKDLRNAIRAHANALEHIIPFLLLLFFLEQKGAGSVLLLALGATFMVARLLHAYGMLGRWFTGRRIGAGLVFLLELAAVGLLGWKAFF